jgi:hypothetical protein
MSRPSRRASASRAAPDLAKTGIGRYLPGAAVQAHLEDRRAIDLGGEQHQPADAGQDRDRKRSPNQLSQPAAQRLKVDL